MMPNSYGPTDRPDSQAPHENVIRRFREELRLARPDFADLLDVNVDTLRVWETEGKSRPRGEAALKIVAFAQRNSYPLQITDIFPDWIEPEVIPANAKKPGKKKKSKKKK